MAQSGTPVSKKPSKKFNRGAKWHAGVAVEGTNTRNCPCKGQPQPVSRKLAARRAAKPADANKMHFIMPGSQNRKK